MIKPLKRNAFFLAALIILPLILSAPVRGDELGIIRLHIIANSNSETDQNLKLLVRDAVLDVSRNIPDGQIENNLDLLQDTARLVLLSHGCDMPAEAQFGKFQFPVRTYGNATLPAGEYTAVRIIIGEGAGKNWWCVMYPPLCFTDQTTAHFDKEFITKNGPTQSGRPNFKIKFKLAEIFSR